MTTIQILMFLLSCAAVAALAVATITLRSATRALERALAAISEEKPTRDRVVLPMSSGDRIIEPRASMVIVGRPENVAFDPQRIIIGGSPENWIVNDIKIDGRSQFSQTGDVPGEMFSATAMDAFIRFQSVGAGKELAIAVTNIGQTSAPFVCGVLGEAGEPTLRIAA